MILVALLLFVPLSLAVPRMVAIVAVPEVVLSLLLHRLLLLYCYLSLINSCLLLIDLGLTGLFHICRLHL
jgi:hypothetical protein